MTFVERIDLELASRNKTRKSLCEKVGISTQSITDWSKKGAVPNAEIMYKIAVELGVSVEYLLHGETAIGDELTPLDQRLIDSFHRVPDQFKPMVLNLAEELAKLIPSS